ncbi:MAG TPA: tRNA (adenosine(37)-N6)-threonylcarbamoyltransferase complex dimerization subunit type 1 TsaB [Burkholderiaceae bacterium]|nr:tRNA (adenosine(37)-N6)-threonylcarbamoyltransferase complex dimerization subunit type 1 TsaB [Burkholderiaceae bacterium]
MTSANPHPPPACLLALGTSGDTCTVALRHSRDGRRVTVTRNGSPQAGRSGQILGLVRALCAEQQVELANIDVIAFDAGPGGFTALRVACGVAQGLGFALERPLLPIGSLAAIAWQAAAGQRVFVAIDARMGEVYCAVFDRPADGEPRAVVLPTVLAPEAAVQLFERCRAVDATAPADAALPQPAPPQQPDDAVGDRAGAIALGDGFARHAALADWYRHRALQCDPTVVPSADALAGLAEQAWRAGRAVAAADAAPFYVRDKVALDVDEQAQARAGSGR